MKHKCKNFKCNKNCEKIFTCTFCLLKILMCTATSQLSSFSKLYCFYVHEKACIVKFLSVKVVDCSYSFDLISILKVNLQN